MIYNKKLIIKRTMLDIPIIVFFLSQLLSAVFSIDFHTSIFGYYGRFNGGLLSLFTYLILFYGFVSNFDFEFAKKLLKISLLSSFLVILWGLPGRFGYDLSCLVFTGQFNNSCWTDQFHPESRMFSTLGQPNWLAAYLAINFFISLYFLIENNLSILRTTDNKQLISDILPMKSLLLSGYILLNLTAILFTRSRSALVSVAIGLAIFSIISIIKFKKNKNIIKYLVAGLLILLITIIIFKTGIGQIDKYLSISNLKTSLFTKVSRDKQKSNLQVKTQNLSQNQTKQINVTESFDIRKIVWEGALNLGKKYPIFGTGVETFAYSYYFVRPQAHNLTSEWDYLYNKAHNEYLNYFATTGFVGLGSYLLLIIIFIGLILIQVKSQSFDYTQDDPERSRMDQKSKVPTPLKLRWVNKITNQNSNFRSNNNEAMKQFDNNLLYLCLFLSYLVILITNFFGFSTTTINLFFFLIPGFIILSLLKSDDKEKIIDPKKFSFNDFKLFNKNQKLLLFSAIIFLILSVVYFTRYWIADVNFAKGDNFSKTNSYQEAAKYIDNALKFKYEHLYEDKLSNILANLAFIASYQKENELSEKLIQASDAYNKKTLYDSPKNILYWKTRAKNYYLYYQINLDPKELNEGINSLTTAQKLSPTDPKLPYSLSVFYSLLADDTKDQASKTSLIKKALTSINLTVDLKPDYRDGYFLKGQLLKKYGRIKEAKQTFEFILNKLNADDEEVKKEIQTF